MPEHLLSAMAPHQGMSAVTCRVSMNHCRAPGGVQLHNPWLANDGSPRAFRTEVAGVSSPRMELPDPGAMGGGGM